MPTIRLKISVSGVRGVVGETLTPQLLTRFAQAFGTYTGPGRILIGRDTRPSGPMVADAVCAGLMSTGCRPVLAGITPIPALQHRCGRRVDIRGGIAITASHNPAEWNALKLLSAEGLFLTTSQASELLDIYHQGTFSRVGGAEIPEAEQDSEVVQAHLDAVVAQVDLELVREARLHLAIDCVNGAGAVATPLLLERLGCKVERIACLPTGQFPRPPEPLPEHLTELQQLVMSCAAAAGFAQDADADRLAVVDERGRPLDGDEMLALLVDLALQRRPGPVVVNLSTSDLVEVVAGRHNVPVFRSPVGEANVVEAMMAQGAVVGGEGSGGLIYPAVHLCRDSFAAMALLLEFLARGESIGRYVDALPLRVRLGQRYDLPAGLSRRLLFELREALADAELDLRDGIKATWSEGWVHVRSSNTEPLLRVVAEASDEKRVLEIHRRIKERIDRLVQAMRPPSFDG